LFLLDTADGLRIMLAGPSTGPNAYRCGLTVAKLSIRVVFSVVPCAVLKGSPSAKNEPEALRDGEPKFTHG
jgi:hypothetical protein